MEIWLLGLIAVLLPIRLAFQVVADVLLHREKFFNFYESLHPARRTMYALAPFVFVAALWSTLSFARIVDPQFLPTPTDTLRALWSSLASGELLPNMLVSLARIAAGFGLASLLGLVIGSVAGVFTRCESLVLPLNSAVRYIPPTAFIGLTIIWFGIGEWSKIALIFLAIFFYVNQMVSDSVKLVPRVYVEAAQTLGANRWEVFTGVILPMSIPDLLSVLRVNLGAAWTYLVVAELVAAQQGLGYLMAVSQRFLQTPKLFAMLLLVGLLGFASDAVFALAIRHYSRWK